MIKTNCDLYLELNSGAKTYVEFKYTEEEFGRAKDDFFLRTHLHLYRRKYLV